MKISLLGTKTGNGHVSVLQSVCAKFIEYNIHPEVEKAFPEEKLSGYDFLSDFYNYLLKTSFELSNKFTEMLVYNRSDKSDKFIDESKEKIIRYLEDSKIDIIVSFAPFINYAIANALKNIDREIIFTTVVTDPFVPYMVGYECPSINYFYVASEDVKSDLIKKGINREKIIVTGFPVSSKFISRKSSIDKSDLKRKLGLDDRKLIFCNSGAEGNVAFLEYLKAIIRLEEKYQALFLCGRNEFLKKSASTIIKNNNANNVKVIGFVDNIDEILDIADLHITKSGANTVFESLYKNVPLFIDASRGILFQEVGIVNFIKHKKLGIVNSKKDSLYENLCVAIDDVNLNIFKQNISQLKLEDAAQVIARHLLYLEKN